MLKEKYLSGYHVSDVCTYKHRHPVTVQADASMNSVLKAEISEQNSNSIYVVDFQNKLLGMINVKDILKKLFPVTSLASGISGGIKGIPAFNANSAADIMIPAKSVKESASLAEAASIFLRENITELPVVNNSNKIVGQINAASIIAFSENCK
jgi:CBS domain-containing protein